ncbi:MAG: hypothetical protein H0X66_08880 [Verrucomicrobia bacterium]|nr:hypothetical protein [Verrucomicrobiota bacterium]
MSDIEQVIPFCRSEFLQDFTIELGMLYDPIKKWGHLYQAEVGTHDFDDGCCLERLTIWLSTYYFTQVSFTLWEDQTIWVSVSLLPTENHSGYKIGFSPQVDVLSFAAMIEALDSTLSVSTRLCYHECPLPLLRKFWRHTGEVEITGKLNQPT